MGRHRNSLYNPQLLDMNVDQIWSHLLPAESHTLRGETNNLSNANNHVGDAPSSHIRNPYLTGSNSYSCDHVAGRASLSENASFSSYDGEGMTGCRWNYTSDSNLLSRTADYPPLTSSLNSGTLVYNTPSSSSASIPYWPQHFSSSGDYRGVGVGEDYYGNMNSNTSTWFNGRNVCKRKSSFSSLAAYEEGGRGYCSSGSSSGPHMREEPIVGSRRGPWGSSTASDYYRGNNPLSIIDGEGLSQRNVRSRSLVQPEVSMLRSSGLHFRSAPDHWLGDGDVITANSTMQFNWNHSTSAVYHRRRMLASENNLRNHDVNGFIGVGTSISMSGSSSRETVGSSIIQCGIPHHSSPTPRIRGSGPYYAQQGTPYQPIVASLISNHHRYQRAPTTSNAAGLLDLGSETHYASTGSLVTGRHVGERFGNNDSSSFGRSPRLERFYSERNIALGQHLMFYSASDLFDEHSDMRLDVDNMSYEELLALEERIGDVNTGLSEDVIFLKCLKVRTYTAENISKDKQLEEGNCIICQEEYEEKEEVGTLDCGHEYHISCIKKWLVQKNVCPVCKAPALADGGHSSR